MDPQNALMRFLYLGTTAPYYIRPKHNAPVQFPTEDVFNTLFELTEPEVIINLVKKAVQSKCLPRFNETAYFLAYCCKKSGKEKLITAVYAAVPEIFPAMDEFFMFLHYIFKCQDENRKGFGRGLKSCIATWYNNKTCIQLANLIGGNRKLFKWSHCDLIKMSHYKTDDLDRARIIDSLFRRGCKTIEDTEVQQETTNVIVYEGFKRVNAIYALKISENPKDAADSMKKNKFPWNFLPSHLIYNPVVWEGVLANINYRDLLNFILKLADTTLLNPNEEISKKISHALGNMQLVTDAKLYPVEIYMVLKLYQSGVRYNDTRNEEWRVKRMKEIKNDPNPQIIKRLQMALNHSYGHFPRTGLRYFITIDLKKAYTKRTSAVKDEFTCMEASVMLAFSLLKREKDVTVMAFSETEGKLQAVPIGRDMNFDKAMSNCNEASVDRTYQDLALPFKSASEQKKKVDIFITIVDSVARTCRAGKPPLDEFRHYKKAMNCKMAKYCVINLTRRGQDFKIPNPSTKGFLEVSGFGIETQKIIEAFSKSYFA